MSRHELRQRGGLTANDMGVLRVLSERHRPMSAYDILKALKGTSVKAPVQVYRALGRLVTQGQIHRIASLNAYVPCDCPVHDTQPAFFVCKKCGSVTEFNLAEAVDPLRRVGIGFQVEEISIELQGTCRNCCGMGSAAA
jgi:Fur family zinc uptake transcriptional regulator